MTAVTTLESSATELQRIKRDLHNSENESNDYDGFPRNSHLNRNHHKKGQSNDHHLNADIDQRCNRPERKLQFVSQLRVIEFSNLLTMPIQCPLPKLHGIIVPHCNASTRNATSAHIIVATIIHVAMRLCDPDTASLSRS
jgi:hypothetical protein